MGYNEDEEEKPKKLPDGYTDQKGYFLDENKEKMNPDFIVGYAKDIAKNLYAGKDKNTPTQIRKYYEFLIRVEKMLKLKKDFSYVEADFLQIISHVEYAKNRDKVTELFLEFINTNVLWVKSEKDLKAFMKHFQSVIAFMRERR